MKRMLLTLLVVPFLATCGHQTSTSGLEANGPPVQLVKPSICRLTSALTWSPRDTTETIKEIKTFNAKWDALCSGTAS